MYILILEFFAYYISGTIYYGSLVLNGTVIPNVWSYNFENFPDLTEAIILGIIALVSPLILSLVFSKKVVDLSKVKIVPPFYVTIIGCSFLALFLIHIQYNFYPIVTLRNAAFSQLRYDSLFLLLLFGVTSFFGEDYIVIKVLGRSASSELIYFEKLRVYHEI